MSVDSLTLFASTPLLAMLPLDVQQALHDEVDQLSLADGHVLFHQGDQGDALYIVADGEIDVYTENEGQQLIVNQFAAGDWFGEMSLIDDKPRSASARTRGQTQLLRLKRDAFLDVLQTPAISLAVVRDLSDKVRFAATFIQKATSWSQLMANGAYEEVLAEVEKERISADSSDESRAANMLAAFLDMARIVREREAAYKAEVHQLRIEIDRAKRKKQVAEITETEHFKSLTAQAAAIKARKARRRGQSE